MYIEMYEYPKQIVWASWWHYMLCWNSLIEWWSRARFLMNDK